MIERDFDVPFIADLALREKQIQQNYRPIIAVHKWFARRPGTLFRGLLLSEFVPGPLRESFYRPQDLTGLSVADPFMGGGTPLIEANRVGCDVIGRDINPMAYWIVRQEIEQLDLNAYRTAAHELRERLDRKLRCLYATRCHYCGSEEAPVKYFLWIKVQVCGQCGKDVELFPSYLLAEDVRHPKNVLVCPKCGDLTECQYRDHPGLCQACGARLFLQGPAKDNPCSCPHCGAMNAYPNPSLGPPRHRLFAIEYYCRRCKPRHKGRFFKRPDAGDETRVAEAERFWASAEPQFVPDDEIPSGDETDRLHRWGYRRYREMFNARQLVGLELSCRLIAEQADERVRNALATNLSDLLRYQNMLCRYDTMALKSLDIFSVHGFPVGLVQCESNLLGIWSSAKGTSIGSGGWCNIVDKYDKAKAYCHEPFEIQHSGGSKTRVRIRGEWIGDQDGAPTSGSTRMVDLRCENAVQMHLPPASLDAVFTDPPYFGNVQYAELMDFCYVWLRRLVGGREPAFKHPSTRHPDELTGNLAMGRGLDHFAEGLSAVFRRMAEALKPGAPLVFTYHHNTIEAYYPVAVAILDSGLTCSASIPCPAEMGASIHISGTGSSIVDTVFVCRSTGSVHRQSIAGSADQIASLVQVDAERLRAGNVRVTRGDIRCIVYGHLIRVATWHLRDGWDAARAASERMDSVGLWIRAIGGPSAVESHLRELLTSAPPLQRAMVRDAGDTYGTDDEQIPF
jgi:putative DNA methylase